MEQNLPTISLREITPGNFSAVLQLKVTDDQKNFVASNVYSLAEAYVFPMRSPMAIYADETPVGFLMYTYLEESQHHWIFRLMIDAAYQGRGYGREAMRQLIAHMAAIPGCTEIYISYEPENDVARKLYASLGFRTEGEILGGEEVAVLQV
jgi:diamine N-acetyltransferase